MSSSMRLVFLIRTQTQNKDHVQTLKEDGHPRAKERSPWKNNLVDT